MPIAVSTKLPWFVLSVLSGPGHLAETTATSTVSIGTEVSNYRLKSAVPDRSLLYWYDYTLDANKSELVTNGCGPE